MSTTLEGFGSGSGSGTRILVVDDDDNHREGLARLLERAGHVVVSTDSGADVSAILGAEQVDLVLLDLHMPEVDGYDVLRLLRRRSDPPRVVIVTGAAEDTSVRRLLQLGANDLLLKPYDADELLECVDTCLRDATRSRATRRLFDQVHASDELYRFLVDQSPDVIYTLDAEGHFTFASASAERVLGASSETLLGTHWAELFAPGERARAARRFDERRSGERATRNLVLRLATAPSTPPRWVQVSAVGLHAGEDDDRRFEGSYGVVRDVTQLRAQEEDRSRLEAQLEQARRMEAIGQLAGGIAHDFNNILASMIGFAELAQTTIESTRGGTDTGTDTGTGSGTGNGAEGYLSEVVSAGHRARDLIAQLLNFSRSEDGNPQVVDMASEIDGVTRMLRAVIPVSVRIERALQTRDAAVRIDPVQLQQVVLNLFINARDAVPEDGVIEVGVERSDFPQEQLCDACGEPFTGAWAVLSVADDGDGIPRELQRKLFDPLVSARPGRRGTGFGLTLVHKIVHRNGGHIRVESTPGAGACFRIHLPLCDEAPVASAATAPLLAATAGPPAAAHIVVVDDEASVASFLKELLEHAGHRTSVFNDPEAALAFIEGHSADIDLVLSDQTMPQMTGIALAAQVTRLAAGLDVVLCTGYGAEAQAAAIDAPGIAAVLTKPFEIRELLAVVDGALAKAAAGARHP